MYFDDIELDQLSSHRTEFLNKRDYRNHVIKHLNQSLFISSPFGRLVSYIKAFQNKYVELKN